MRRKKPTGEDAWSRLDYERNKRSTMEGIIHSAMAGDAESAARIMSIANGFIQQADNIPEALREYLLCCFNRIRQGEDPNHAFNFQTSKAGRSNDYWKEARDADVARCVKAYLEQHADKTIDDAFDDVASHYSGFKMAGVVGTDTVKKAYHRFYPKPGKQ